MQAQQQTASQPMNSSIMQSLKYTAEHRQQQPANLPQNPLGLQMQNKPSEMLRPFPQQVVEAANFSLSSSWLISKGDRLESGLISSVVMLVSTRHIDRREYRKIICMAQRHQCSNEHLGRNCRSSFFLSRTDCFPG